MDISIMVGFETYDTSEEDFMATYCALFDLLGEVFGSVHSLRLELRMPPFDMFDDFFNEQRMNAIIEPFDRLSKSRSWTRLQLCAPYDWYPHFNKFKQAMPWQTEWELTSTEWSQQVPLAMCVGMT